VPIALAALDCLWELRDGYVELARACEEYADSVEEHRAVVRGIVTDLALEAGLGIAAGGGLVLRLDAEARLVVGADERFESWEYTGPRGERLLSAPGGELVTWGPR
jgi:hypothetical protein